MSFSKSADQLNVTKVVVSRQVNALEEDLGMPLLRRMNRARVLTAAGQSQLPPISEALGLMAAAAKQLYHQDKAGLQTITTIDSFAAEWLVPRLGWFRKEHPGIDVRIATSDECVDFIHENVELAIRYGAGKWSEVIA